MGTARHFEGECRDGRCVYCGERGHIIALCPHQRRERENRTAQRGPTMGVAATGKVVIPTTKWDGYNNNITANQKQRETLKTFAAELTGIYECIITFRTIETDWKAKQGTIKEILKHQGMQECKPKCIQRTGDSRKVIVAFGTKQEQERFETERNFNVDEARAEVLSIRAKGKATTKVIVSGFPIKKPVAALKDLMGYFGEIEGEIMENTIPWEDADDNGNEETPPVSDGV